MAGVVNTPAIFRGAITIFERAAGSRKHPVVAFGRLLRFGGVMRQKSMIAFVSGGRRAGVLLYGDENRVE